MASVARVALGTFPAHFVFLCDDRRSAAYQSWMRSRSTLAAVLCSLAAASSVFGWGGEGHQLTALVASAHLTPAARASCNALLGKDADGLQVNIYDGEVANWADRVRREREGSGPYHYVDIPVEAPKYDADRDGNKGDNVIDKLAEYAEKLRDSKTPRAAREEALRWVVHLAGDLHQPLHCAERDKDRGGNSRLAFLLDATGKASNLHAIWDSGLLRLIIKDRSISVVANEFDKKITPKQIKEWSTGTPTDWANQSHDVAVKVVYAGVPADGPPPRLDQKYVARANPVLIEQIDKGGIRLANLLNKCFAESPVAR